MIKAGFAQRLFRSISAAQLSGRPLGASLYLSCITFVKQGTRMPLMGKDARIRMTERLRLEPITRAHAEDYFLVFQDDAVAEWYAGKLTLAQAQHAANEAERHWKTIGFHKWLVYDRETGTVVGRAGVSAMGLQAYAGAIRSFLPPQAWADEVRDTNEPTQFARWWVRSGGHSAARIGVVDTLRKSADTGCASRLTNSICMR
jgi:hypothetical protein